MVSNPTLPTENINQVILGLLKIKSGTELDYQTYFNIIKKRLAIHRMVGAEIPAEEDELLREELKRVGKIKDKGRFKIKEKTVKVTDKPKTSAPKTGAIIKAPFAGITKDFIKPPVEPVAVKDVADKTSKIGKETNILQSINKTLESILSTLIDTNKQNINESEKRRRSEEEKKRTGRESSLESKTFEGIKKAISTITKPFQSIWDKIVNFITNIILGRIVLKLIDWIADPKNQGKIQSIIRFVKDWWPALLGSYILFGTKFGGLIRFIGGWAVKLAFQLGKVIIPKLLTLIAKNPIAALAVAGGIGAYAATQQNKERRDESAKTDPSIVKPEETAKTGKGPGPLQLSEEQIGQQGLGLAFSGGGEVRWPGFSGGGFNFRGMMGGASMGAMFGPLGMLLGGALGSGKPQEMFSGFVKGPGGPKDDKVPAMLSDGEFVMSAGAVQKYGVDTLESMNAAGGGDNTPVIKSDGIVRAAGGGLIGDIPLSGTYGTNPSDDALRRAARTFNRFGSEEDLFKTFKKLNGVPDFGKMVGENNLSRIFQGQSGGDDALDSIRRSVSDKLKSVNNPQSFTQSSRAASGLNDLVKKFDIDAKTAPRYAENLPKLNKPKPRVTRIDPSRMLPSAGQSSANAMRAAARTARISRPPIPTSSSIVPYAGGGLVRSGVTAGLSESIPQIRTNMNVPGGRIRGGSLSAIMAAFEMKQRKDEGQTNAQAGLGAGASALGGQLGWMSGAKAGALAGAAIGSIVPGLGTGVGAAVGAVAGGILGGYGGAMAGGKIADDFSGVNAKKERATRGVGGDIVGGYGLKGQSFKDAPKTSIITDDKGRPYVGHKALKNGKLTYVKSSAPGTGTTNPLEMLGRFINPGAYKDSDAKIGMKNQKIAMVNALESMQKQGMAPDAQARMMKQMGGNLKDTQNDLNYRKKMSISGSQIRKPAVKPLPRATPRPQVAGGGMGGRRGGGANPPRQGTKPPSQSPTHRRGTMTSASAYGIMR